VETGKGNTLSLPWLHADIITDQITAEKRRILAGQAALPLHPVCWRRRLWTCHTTQFQSHLCT